MAKPQVKTQKVISLIEDMKRNLSSRITLNVYTYNDTVSIDYTACERRAYPLEIAKKYKKDIDSFVFIWNKTSFSKGQKLKPVNISDYEDDDYSEYEIEVGRSVRIPLGKNQSQFFKQFES